jgi:hypothetical protein
MKTTIPQLKHSMNRTPYQLGLLLIPLVLACLTLAPQVRATCQEGCLTNFNTVLGEDALLNTTTGLANTAIGWKALTSNTTGGSNTAVGLGVLEHNTDGHDNTGFGYAALIENTSGFENTALGSGALFSNSTGGNNTAIGGGALQSNTTGSGNTATGLAALVHNLGGNNNTATGESALNSHMIGDGNTANGGGALRSHTIGNRNIALGFHAGKNLTVGSDNIAIGNPGIRDEFGVIRIGNAERHISTYIAGINGITVAGGVTVVVDTSGHLGTMTSSARFKENMQPMDKASEAILALRPVTFRYKHEFDPKGIPQFGLVAEQVEKVNPDLVARDDEGKPFTVRYEAVNAMLLNEFLKEHLKVELQDRNAQEQQKEIDALKAELKEQRSLIQKVSAQLELSSAAPQTVLNNQQ